VHADQSLYSWSLFARVRLLKGISFRPHENWDTENSNNAILDAQYLCMIDHLCRVLRPYKSMENEDEERLRYSLKVICNKAHILGVKFTHMCPRYQFNCLSSVDSLSLLPEVWKATDYWGEQYESNDLLIEGVKVDITRFFESCPTVEPPRADELVGATDA